jgi:putative ABC transport system substrate-binding protein
MMCGLGIAAMGRSLAALSQTNVKAKIGWLAVGPITTSKRVFLEALKQRGYAEGVNLVLEERYPRNIEQYPELVAELIRLKVDVLVTTGGAASRAAKAATTSVPIVFLTTDPMGAGLITSLARPKDNLSGVAIITQDFNAKRVETITAMVPASRQLRRSVTPREH